MFSCSLNLIWLPKMNAKWLVSCTVWLLLLLSLISCSLAMFLAGFVWPNVITKRWRRRIRLTSTQSVKTKLNLVLLGSQPQILITKPEHPNTWPRLSSASHVAQFPRPFITDLVEWIPHSFQLCLTHMKCASYISIKLFPGVEHSVQHTPCAILSRFHFLFFLTPPPVCSLSIYLAV